MCGNNLRHPPDTSIALQRSPNRELAPDEVIAVIAHVLEKAGLATTAIGKKIGFRVHGERGGDWVVDLSSPGGAWSQPSDPEVVERCVATTLFAESEAFSHLITNPDRLEEDLKSGFLAVEGERACFVRLGRLLKSSGGMLSQRVRQSGQEKNPNKKTNRRF
jgi:hypothetical protein